eukprot:scaffold49386_cov60-Phaeocystis_antarctica.AAC.8
MVTNQFLAAASAGVAIFGAAVIGLLHGTWPERTTAPPQGSKKAPDASDASAAADLPTDVVSLLIDHLPVIDAVCVAATCVAWRDAMELGALSAFRAVSGSAAPLAQTPVLDNVGVTKESWAALLLLSRLVHTRASSITSCDPFPHEPAALNRSEPGSMAAHIRNVLRQVRHPRTVSQVVDKLSRKFYMHMLNDDPDSFARRFASEVGEPCSRCTQPLSRKTTLAYWIELFVHFLQVDVHSTADLHERTRHFL